MKITVDKTDYRVKFFHSGFSDREPRSTVCEIWDVTNEIPLTPESVGVASCHPDDRFIRATGRKIALTRAVENYEKPDRKQFWEGYWNSLGSKVRR